KTLPSGAQAISCLANLARALLSQGHIEKSAQLLDEIDESVSDDRDRMVYAFRYAALARSIVLFRQNRRQEAISQAESVLRICDQVGDRMLKRKTQLTKAEILLAECRLDEFRTILSDALASSDGDSPQLQVQREQLIC